MNSGNSAIPTTGSTPGDAAFEPVDPFDLPEVLGTDDVVWHALDGLHDSHLVRGSLVVEGHDDVPCDLFAVDEAYPRPVADDALRALTHQAWRHGQVHLLGVGGRLTLAVPGNRFTAEIAMAAVERLAKALGAVPACYAVHLRLGG